MRYLAAGSADQAKQLVEDALGYFRVHLSQHDEEAEAAAVGVQCKVLLSLGRPTKALVACRLARRSSSTHASATNRKAGT